MDQKEIEALVAERRQAKARASEIEMELASYGVMLTDTRQGTAWELQARPKIRDDASVDRVTFSSRGGLIIGRGKKGPPIFNCGADGSVTLDNCVIVAQERIPDLDAFMRSLKPVEPF